MKLTIREYAKRTGQKVTAVRQQVHRKTLKAVLRERPFPHYLIDSKLVENYNQQKEIRNETAK